MIDTPAGWPQVAFRGATTGVIAFVVLQAKELFDAGRLDTPATAVDAGIIAAGVLLVNAVMKWMK